MMVGEAAGGIALGIEVDVRDREAVEAMVAQVVQEWGRIDVLVANAGGGLNGDYLSDGMTEIRSVPLFEAVNEQVAERLDGNGFKTGLTAING